MYAYKPERIDTDDEEEWEEEENHIIKSKIISSFNVESDSELGSDSENDTKPIIENPIKFNRESKSI